MAYLKRNKAINKSGYKKDLYRTIATSLLTTKPITKKPIKTDNIKAWKSPWSWYKLLARLEKYIAKNNTNRFSRAIINTKKDFIGHKEGTKRANKILSKYAKLQQEGKTSQAKQLLDREMKKGTFVSEAGEALTPVSSGILGHSKKYAEMISNVASQYPKTAVALDEFISNGLAFGAHGQFKSHLPVWDMTERSKQFVNDAIVGSMFTIAGSPQFLETSKIRNKSLSLQ